MRKKDEIWIGMMEWCSKYWGCHQLPERSFFWKGYQFPVCARCTGMIVGYIASLIYGTFFEKLKVIIEIIFIIPMLVDGTLQLFTQYRSNNAKRFTTGLLAGFGLIQFIKSVLSFAF